MDESTNWITPLYAGLLGLLLLYLSYSVSRERLRYKVALGDGGQPSLQRAIRAQANLAEYAPLALVLLGGVEAQGFSPKVIHALGVLLVFGRLLHSIGLSLNAGPSAPRGIGATLTWLMILLASGLAIFSVIFPGRF